MRQKDVTLILIVLLLLAGLYLLRPESQDKTVGESESSSQNSNARAAQSPTWNKIEKSIDAHMKLGRRSEELRRDLTAIENQMQAPPIDPAKIDPGVFDPNAPIPLKLNAEDAAVKAYKDAVE